MLKVILSLAEGLQSAHPLHVIPITRPVHFACFSKVGGKVSFCADAGRPPSFTLPHPPMDLNEGLSTFVAPNEGETGDVAHIIDAALHSGVRDWQDVHFITYRNNLNKILETPYAKQDWKIELHRVGDVIVM